MKRLLTVTFLMVTFSCSTVKNYQIESKPIKPYAIKEKKSFTVNNTKLVFSNNNPFNIRNSNNNWKGKVHSNEDFEQFSNVEYGIRAGFKLIRNYKSLYEVTTIKKLVSRFAPSCENNTKGYIKFICNMTGLKQNEQINLHDSTTLILISKYMIQMESGTSIELTYLKQIYFKYFENGNIKA